jgi:3-isopropylmalate dehydrogenase
MTRLQKSAIQNRSMGSSEDSGYSTSHRQDGTVSLPKTGVLVGYFEGEGIGQEIIPIALRILERACAKSGVVLHLREGGLIGNPAAEISGSPMPPAVVEFCDGVFSDGGTILCGPGGGRFVYDLRKRFDLYCKFTPLVPARALGDVGCLKPAHVAGVDILAVRENTGGLYLGGSTVGITETGDEVVTHCFQYTAAQVRRILEAAFAAAAQRRGRVCVTVKPGGVPLISQLWASEARELAKETGISLSILEIDHAVYQMIASPGAFDVFVSPNMFGDVLADAGALLLGSRGMSYSGNFDSEGRAVYQTGHGAAHDLAGTDRANPLGQVLSVAMMLRESLGLPEAAALVEEAIHRVLAKGFRTQDIAGPRSTVVGTQEMGQRVLQALEEGPDQ